MRNRSIWNLLFLISAGVLAGFFLVSGWQEINPEWRGYQVQYFRQVRQITGQPAADPGIAIRQIHLPEFNRTDRCVTCHMGIDNPRMKEAPQPFTTHPDLGIDGFLGAHDFTQIGCTVCHQGQGQATTVEAGHGHEKHWEYPMLPPGLTVANCASCHGDVATLPGAEMLVRGRELFEEKGCIGCHSLNGWGNPIAPELADTAGKNVHQFDFRHVEGEHTVVDWIVEHFKDPQKVTPADPALGVPESSMPDYELTDEEVMALTALVLSFSAEAGNPIFPVPHRFKVPGKPAPEPVYASSVEHGKAVYEKYGCAACHGFAGRGGIPNKNMDLGGEAPTLVYVSRGYTREELKQVIQHGRFPARALADEPPPPLWMPAWEQKLSDEELEVLMDYLISLEPKDAAPAGKEG
ncbi:MAG: hypothetical protein COV76_05515 [Candidatus Omnitrophica bacterium CG11_big_fil_rev_8_21_14_0_20_64_10]|nr:MAG: hypothetical protein COV76_05515 [Candidatus Omnitrophica bacterium CG11_big_fil_rev_8_21_14_0_20_64_10]